MESVEIPKVRYQERLNALMAQPTQQSKPNVPLLPEELSALEQAIANSERWKINMTPEAMEEILTRLSNGEPLAQICRDKHLPSYSAVWDWGKKVPLIGEALARARDSGYDVIASKTREIARGLGESSKDVQRDRLIIETDLKLLASWDNARYGQRMKVDGTVNNTSTVAIQMTTQQLTGELMKLAEGHQLPPGVKLLDNGAVEIDGDYEPVEPPSTSK